MPAWHNDYLCGTGMEMYTEYLSHAFVGTTFAQAAEICFTKLKLLLLAIEVSDSNGDGSANIVINPKGEHRLRSNTQGFFMAQSADEVKRAIWYCKTCHDDIVDEKMIKKCKCRNRKSHVNQPTSSRILYILSVCDNNQLTLLHFYTCNQLVPYLKKVFVRCK